MTQREAVELLRAVAEGVGLLRVRGDRLEATSLRHAWAQIDLGLRAGLVFAAWCQQVTLTGYPGALEGSLHPRPRWLPIGQMPRLVVASPGAIHGLTWIGSSAAWTNQPSPSKPHDHRAGGSISSRRL